MGKYLDSSGLTYLWSKIKAFFVKGNGKVFIGTCDTAAATVAKVVDCDNFTSSDLVIGATIYVSFEETNSGAVADLTMNVNGTGAKGIKYINNNARGNIPGVGYLVAGLTYQFIYDGTYWVVQMNYNTNTNDTTSGYGRHTYANWSPTTALGRYVLSFTKNETQIVPATAVNNSVATTKALTTESFNPFEPIFYYSTTAQIAAGTNISASYLWFGYERIDLRYSFNTGTTLTAHKDVFIKCVLQSDGSAKLASGNPIVQSLPTTDDGFIYIHLGRAYDTYRISFTFTHNVYEFKNGGIQLLTRDAATVNGHTVAADVPSDLNNKLATISSLDGDVDSLWEEVNNLGLELNDKVDKVSGKGLSTNDFTDALETKLNGVATGAEVNQNAFSNVKVGSTTVAADAKTDTLELVAGSNITLTPDATNDKVTIAATDTTYSAGDGLELSSGAFGLESGVVTAGSAGPTAAVTGSNNTTVAIPRITVDTYGRVTGLTSYNLTNKDTTYTNLTLGQGYGTCSTAASTVAKVGTLSGYTLTTGGVVAIKFTYAVPASATLNINSKGAKAIYHKGAAIKANVIHAGDTATFLYNGSYYHLLAVDRATVTDVDDDYENTNTITFPNGTMMQTGAYQFNFGSANYVDFTCTLNTPMSSTGYKVFFSASASNSTQALAPIFELKSKTTSNFVVRAWKNLSSTSTISDWCGWLAIGK